MNIKLKSTFFLGLPFFLVVIVIGVVMFFMANITTLNEMSQHLSSVAALKELSLNAYFDTVEDQIAEQQLGIAYQAAITDLSEYSDDKSSEEYVVAYEILDDRYSSFTEVHEQFEQLFFVDDEGYVVYQSDKNRPHDHQGQHLSEVFSFDFAFFDVSKSGFYRADILVDDYHDGNHKMIVGAPLFSEEGVFVGEIIASVELQFIYDLFEERTGLGETGETLIAHWHNDDMAMFLNERLFEGEEGAQEMVPADQVGIPIIAALNGEEAFFDDYTDYRGEEVIAYTSYLEEVGWGLVVKMDSAEAFSSLGDLFFVFAMMFSASVLLLLLLIYVFVRTVITDPVNKFKMGVKKISEGDLGYQIEVDSKDEFGEFSRVFNLMIDSVKKSRSDVDAKIEEQTKNLQAKKLELEKQSKALVNIIDDVNEEKIRSDNLAKDLRKFKLAVENTSDHVVITDADGIILFANPAVETITGFAPEDVLGLKAGASDTWGGLMPKEVYVDMWKTIKEDKKSFVGELTNQRKNGEKYLVEASIAPVLDDQGRVVFFVGTERDITKAKEVDKMKTEFISLASHQLRTPLAAMRWFSEMLLSGDAGDLNGEQKDFVQNIYDSNKRMIDLVNALLNISRIESGRIIIEPKPTNLLDLVNSILAELDMRLKKKNITVVASMSEHIGEVNVDSKMVGEVYTNLLTNAIKYSPEGAEITIFISEKDGEIISQVADTGYGIPKEDHNKIFEKFFRAQNAVKYEPDGNGLGMYLVKAIIESSGGKIWFESEVGKGSTFWFSLPKEGVEAKSGEVHIT